MFKVGFVQWQKHRDLPHMNMPLFVGDLREQGCLVDCVCANSFWPGNFLRYFKRAKFDLLATDYNCPYPVIAKMKKIYPQVKIVTGGNGFFDIFQKTRIDFGIIGAGRKSMCLLAEALKNRKTIKHVPNLFFKTGSGQIDYSGKDIAFELEKELFPYRPQLDWKYTGFGRSVAPTSPPTVVAEYGCPLRAGKIKKSAQAGFVCKYPALTGKARARLARLIRERNSGGCAFCTYPLYRGLSVKQTNNILLRQMRYLQDTYGYREFSIGSEQPLRFLLPLIRQALREKISFKQLNLRTRVGWLLSGQERLRQALELAVKHDFNLTVWQLGFESFHQDSLDRYGKKQSSRQNLQAVALLDDLKNKYGNNFSNLIKTHGVMGLTPWASLKDIRAEFRILKKLPAHWQEALPFLFPKKLPFNPRLILYDRFIPVYRCIEKQGLMLPQRNGPDDFKMIDPAVNRLLDYLHAGLFHERNANFQAAISVYKKALGELPDNGYLYFLLGHAYFGSGNYQEALKFVSRAKALNYLESRVYFLSGVAYERTGKYRQAIEELKKGAGLNPHPPLAVKSCLTRCYRHAAGSDKKRGASFKVGSMRKDSWRRPKRRR